MTKTKLRAECPLADSLCGSHLPMTPCFILYSPERAGLAAQVGHTLPLSARSRPFGVLIDTFRTLHT